MRHRAQEPLERVLVALVTASMVLGACTFTAVPTPTPTKAAPSAPNVEATKPLAPADASAVAKPTGKPIKIGFITPLTGGAAGYGARQKIAAWLAVEDINGAGGVNGMPVELVTLDDAANPRDDVTLVRRLAGEDKVLAIVGPLTSASFEVAAPLANELKVPLVTATSTKPGITDQNRPWVFRFSILDAAVTPMAVEGYRKLYPNVRKMVITGDTKEPVSEYILKSVYPKVLKDAGLEVIGTVPFETGTNDFSAIVTRIKGLNPGGIAYSSLTPEAVAIAKEFQRQGLKAPVVASLQNWGGPEIVLASDTIEGWVGGGTFDEDTQDQRGKTYLQRFVKIGEADPGVGKPAYSGIWTQTYDTIMAIAEVMREAQVTTDMDLQKARTAVREGLQNLKGFTGITGDTSVLPNGDISTAPLAFVARAGKWVRIK